MLHILDLYNNILILFFKQISTHVDVRLYNLFMLKQTIAQFR